MTQYLSFDIGGTNLKYALIDQEGHILEKDRVKTNTENLDAFMQTMYEVADKYQGKFAGIAVCAPGKIDTKNKIIYFGGALPFLDGLNLEETLGKKYDVPVGVENDGKAAALSEQWLGELSWMITNSSIGTRNMAAYAGFSCSAVNMIKKVNLALGNIDLDNGLTAFEAINNGDLRALAVFKRYCRNVAIMILNIQAVINGSKVVIGGGISAQPILIEEINNQFDKILQNNPMLNNQVIKPVIVAAKNGNDSNLYGALYALLLELNDEEVR